MWCGDHVVRAAQRHTREHKDKQCTAKAPEPRTRRPQVDMTVCTVPMPSAESREHTLVGTAPSCGLRGAQAAFRVPFALLRNDEPSMTQMTCVVNRRSDVITLRLEFG